MCVLFFWFLFNYFFHIFAMCSFVLFNAHHDQLCYYFINYQHHHRHGRRHERSPSWLTIIANIHQCSFVQSVKFDQNYLANIRHMCVWQRRDQYIIPQQRFQTFRDEIAAQKYDILFLTLSIHLFYVFPGRYAPTPNYSACKRIVMYIILFFIAPL